MQFSKSAQKLSFLLPCCYVTLVLKDLNILLHALFIKTKDRIPQVLFEKFAVSFKALLTFLDFQPPPLTPTPCDDAEVFFEDCI